MSMDSILKGAYNTLEIRVLIVDVAVDTIEGIDMLFLNKNNSNCNHNDNDNNNILYCIVGW